MSALNEKARQPSSSCPSTRPACGSTRIQKRMDPDLFKRSGRIFRLKSANSFLPPALPKTSCSCSNLEPLLNMNKTLFKRCFSLCGDRITECQWKHKNLEWTKKTNNWNINSTKKTNNSTNLSKRNLAVRQSTGTEKNPSVCGEWISTVITWGNHCNLFLQTLKIYNKCSGSIRRRKWNT